MYDENYLVTRLKDVEFQQLFIKESLHSYLCTNNIEPLCNALNLIIESKTNLKINLSDELLKAISKSNNSLDALLIIDKILKTLGYSMLLETRKRA